MIQLTSHAFHWRSFPDREAISNAIQTDGFNPIWQEVQIVFHPGFTLQLTRDDDITAAAQAGEVTLIPTTDVYRCSVVGSK